MSQRAISAGSEHALLSPGVVHPVHRFVNRGVGGQGKGFSDGLADDVRVRRQPIGISADDDVLWPSVERAAHVSVSPVVVAPDWDGGVAASSGPFPVYRWG